MNIAALLGAVVVGFLALVLSFRLFFACRDDFFDAIRHCFTPDFISLLKGEWTEDQWNELKLFVWLALSGLAAYGAYSFIESI
ncbi:hypothetical protein ACWPKO_00365 [Coraliomargarita sp. W4R53]